MDNHPLQPRLGEPEQAALPRSDGTFVKGIDLMSVHQCEEIAVTERPPLAGAAPLRGCNAGINGGLVDVSVHQVPRVGNEVAPVKRKRGRPPKGQPKIPPLPQSRTVEDEEEEDVCFICFDGGDLVLCDRRNCPKAYHPACIKRDEAFFQTRAKWNCGWHICSTCQKSSSYMCYTCTYSVCKRCIKDADYVSIRGNMGLCAMCMNTIKLIENVAEGDKQLVKVDFDDKTSWEYLFKVYWLCLKEKLSLTLDELTKAKNPWKEVSNFTRSGELRDELNDHSYSRAYRSDNSYVDDAENGTKRRRTNNSPAVLNKVEAKISGNNQEKLRGGVNWATKELLELVAFMKNGDMSELSQFDVQNLLLDYIKMKNLRDPQQKSQVICDLMLVKLFGKQRVGHLEMLKLLESHFLIQENSSDVKTTNGGASCTTHSQKADDCGQDMMGSDRRRKIRKKADDGVQIPNRDEYAAIDFHNINLIYLRHKFLEKLLDEAGEVHKKAVGTIARIRVSGSDQKLNIHRLVQVVGTCKAPKSYQIGSRTTDVMLEILNLDKREVISVDILSDQDITEDECKRLRQSIKCGLNKRLTVGEILEKAAMFQAMRVNEALEAEILKLNYLRDRASENGHRKELRECVEKLELLKSPEERQRRMHETPEVHTDPSMDQSHASAEDAKIATTKQVNEAKKKSKGPQDKGGSLNNCGNSAQKSSGARFLRSGNVCPTVYTDRDATSKVHTTSDVQGTGTAGDDEREIWNYQDPTGKIQGPFSMAQLRRWKASGHFPPYLRIWRNHAKREESVLLTDALAGRFNEASSLPTASSSSKPQPPKLPFRSGLDVNASSDQADNMLCENPTVNNTSSSSGSTSLVPAAVHNPNERQVESIVSKDDSNCPPPPPPSSSSSSVIPGSDITHKVKGIAGTHVSKDVSTDGNRREDSENTCSLSLNKPNLNQEIRFLDFHSPTPKSSPEDLEAQAAETIQSLSSSFLVKGPSGVTWSTTTTSTTPSAVINGRLLPQVAQQNGGVMASPSEKPAVMMNDHVAHSSGWPAIVADPDDCDESVSDLLAEVEAMEQNGLPSSPTSTFHCDDDDDDLTKGPEKDFFLPVTRMSVLSETCRSDTSQVGILLSAETTSLNLEPKESSKAMNGLVSHYGTTAPELPLFVPPPPISHDLTLTTTALTLGSETTAEVGAVESISKSASGIFSDPCPKTSSGHSSARGSIERSPWGGQQQRYSSSERSTIASHREREAHCRDSGVGKERQWWNNGSSHSQSSGYNHSNNRQWPYNNSSHSHSHDHGHGLGQGRGSGSYAAHPPKGLRICKFYESGYCKKGVSCSFWHP